MSVPFRAEQAATWAEGKLTHGAADASLSGVTIDSRSVAAGDLFVAIAGPKHDGHRFLSDVVGRGAAGLLVERGRADLSGLARRAIAIVEVDDSTRALGALAAGHRAGFEGPLVAITGSNGKTTTKEMCAAILSQRAPCHRTPGNLNNQFGLPLTLLGREAEHETLVVELGMNHRGEIAELVALAQPTVGVITNVGTAHIEHLGSEDEIAAEKGDIVAALPPEATAVLNADDPRVAAQASRTRAHVLRFGRGTSADVLAENVQACDDAGFAFDLVAPRGTTPVRVAGLGEPTVHNALAAAAAALAAGASLDDVTKGLASHRPISGRMQPIALAGGVVLVDDSYNANPQSTEAALRMLAGRERRRALAILGDMGELGEAADSAHRATGALAATLGIDFLIALGERAPIIAEGALAAGMAPERVAVADDHADASARALAILRDNDCVLVKGSRAMQMERVAEAIAAERGV